MDLNNVMVTGWTWKHLDLDRLCSIISLDTAEKQHSIGEVWLPYYDTRLYNTSTIHRVSRRPKFVVLIYFHTTTTLLVIRHLLGLVCHIIETINVHQRGDPQGSYAISALEHAGEHRGTL